MDWRVDFWRVLRQDRDTDYFAEYGAFNFSLWPFRKVSLLQGQFRENLSREECDLTALVEPLPKHLSYFLQAENSKKLSLTSTICSRESGTVNCCPAAAKPPAYLHTSLCRRPG